MDSEGKVNIILEYVNFNTQNHIKAFGKLSLLCKSNE